MELKTYLILDKLFFFFSSLPERTTCDLRLSYKIKFPEDLSPNVCDVRAVAVTGSVQPIRIFVINDYILNPFQLVHKRKPISLILALIL